MSEDHQLFILQIVVGIVFIRVFIPVEAAQTNPACQTIELLYPQLTVVIDRIQITVDDLIEHALACIDANRCPIAQHRQHAVAAHCHALCLVKLHAIVAQAALAKTQPGTLALFNGKAPRPGST